MAECLTIDPADVFPAATMRLASARPIILEILCRHLKNELVLLARQWALHHPGLPSNPIIAVISI